MANITGGTFDSPTDWGGADITPADGDIIWGAFKNVGTFNIQSGRTVHIRRFLNGGVTNDSKSGKLKIIANSIIVDGALMGDGCGFPGGGGGGGGTGAGGTLGAAEGYKTPVVVDGETYLRFSGSGFASHTEVNGEYIVYAPFKTSSSGYLTTKYNGNFVFRRLDTINKNIFVYWNGSRWNIVDATTNDPSTDITILTTSTLLYYFAGPLTVGAWTKNGGGAEGTTSYVTNGSNGRVGGAGGANNGGNTKDWLNNDPTAQGSGSGTDFVNYKNAGTDPYFHYMLDRWGFPGKGATSAVVGESAKKGGSTDRDPTTYNGRNMNFSGGGQIKYTVSGTTIISATQYINGSDYDDGTYIQSVPGNPTGSGGTIQFTITAGSISSIGAIVGGTGYANGVDFIFSPSLGIVNQVVYAENEVDGMMGSGGAGGGGGYKSGATAGGGGGGGGPGGAYIILQARNSLQINGKIYSRGWRGVGGSDAVGAAGGAGGNSLILNGNDQPDYISVNTTGKGGNGTGAGTAGGDGGSGSGGCITLVCRGYLAFTNIVGSHTGSNNAAILTDNTKSWTINELVGKIVYNIIDNSSGIITANSATTVTATLSGGTQNDWDNGESYKISNYNLIDDRGGPNASLSAPPAYDDFNSYNGGTVKVFASNRTYDIWKAEAGFSDPGPIFINSGKYGTYKSIPEYFPFFSPVSDYPSAAYDGATPTNISLTPIISWHNNYGYLPDGLTYVGHPGHSSFYTGTNKYGGSASTYFVAISENISDLKIDDPTTHLEYTDITGVTYPQYPQKYWAKVTGIEIAIPFCMITASGAHAGELRCRYESIANIRLDRAKTYYYRIIAKRTVVEDDDLFSYPTSTQYTAKTYQSVWPYTTNEYMSYSPIYQFSTIATSDPAHTLIIPTTGVKHLKTTFDKIQIVKNDQFHVKISSVPTDGTNYYASGDHFLTTLMIKGK